MKRFLSLTAFMLLIIGLAGSASAVTIRWGGYQKFNSPSPSAVGDIKVPTITCNTGDNGKALAGWVGVDDGQFLSQAGFSAFCSGSTEVYNVWYEVYPHPAQNASVTVSPGQTLRVNVYVDTNVVRFNITNVQTQVTASHTVNEPGAQAGIRLWIAEDGIGGQVAPTFTQITFTKSGGFPSGMTKAENTPPFNVGAVSSCGGTCQSFWVRDSR